MPLELIFTLARGVTWVAFLKNCRASKCHKHKGHPERPLRLEECIPPEPFVEGSVERAWPTARIAPGF